MLRITACFILPLALTAASDPEQLVKVVNMESSVAPDGTIAFVSDRTGALELFVARPDGKELRQLTQGGGKDGPDWSPDGSQIAFVSEAGGNADIFVISRNGGEARRLTSSPYDDIHPFWSPDGKQIVFTRLKAGATDKDIRLDVFVMRADGTGERQITTGTSASYASLSPDGRHLAYWRFFGENADIVVADADGRNERRMTSEAAFEGWPTWSPDGRRIAFVREIESGRTADIMLIDAVTGVITRAVTGPGRKTSPKWSADGKQILFDRSLDGQIGVWRIEAPIG